MITWPCLSIKKACIVQVIFLAILFAGCASLWTEPLFGLTKKTPPEKVATVKVGQLFSGASNGVWVYREGIARAEFATKRYIRLPPGFYMFRVTSLSQYQVFRKGSTVVRTPLLYNVPLKVEAGKKYELRRVRTPATEEIQTREIQ